MKFFEHERANIARDTISHGDLQELSKDTESRTESIQIFDKMGLVYIVN